VDDTKQTLIEDGTEFDGKIRSKCSIVLSGTVKGELTAPTLLVTPSGSVQGQVKVSQLNSQGNIAGEIEAGTVELSGRVSDQTVIRAKTLEVKLDQASRGVQVTFDSCELQVGQDVVKEQPTKDSSSKPAKAPAKVASSQPAKVQAKTAPKPAVAEKTADAESSGDVVSQAMDLMLKK